MAIESFTSMQANSMMYLGENYRATAAYDRGLINDIYGVHSFDEDINKRIKQISIRDLQVYCICSHFDYMNIPCFCPQCVLLLIARARA